MPQCTVLGCKIRKTVFNFPRDFEIRQIWEERVGRESYPKCSVICTRHFHESCLVEVHAGTPNAKLRLKYGSLPTLFLPKPYDDIKLTNIRYIGPKSSLKPLNIWDHFVVLEGKKIKCMHCEIIFEFSDMPKLRRHVFTEHPMNVGDCTYLPEDDKIIHPFKCDTNLPKTTEKIEKEESGIDIGGEKYEVIEYIENCHESTEFSLKKFGEFVIKEIRSVVLVSDQCLLMRRIENLIMATKREIEERLSDPKVTNTANLSSYSVKIRAPSKKDASVNTPINFGLDRLLKDAKSVQKASRIMKTVQTQTVQEAPSPMVLVPMVILPEAPKANPVSKAMVSASAAKVHLQKSEVKKAPRTKKDAASNTPWDVSQDMLMESAQKALDAATTKSAGADLEAAVPTTSMDIDPLFLEFQAKSAENDSSATVAIESTDATTSMDIDPLIIEAEGTDSAAKVSLSAETKTSILKSAKVSSSSATMDIDPIDLRDIPPKSAAKISPSATSMEAIASKRRTSMDTKAEDPPEVLITRKIKNKKIVRLPRILK